ncbi:hypothetical protein BBK36DRAFT_1118673 [Trichoderma citrinoviride]|uniref:WW domain-containing protein n=1 Tax=Trichoderma citrinoviride TaxID=58853 RepID=A0A2T4BAU1_9HYPO|nr:hypothetical protein BBK36DRAFT_1118673 [Trichoderma citrinoviride]PTB66329.1 hypothetical protein BBK36DRAFT_1118673 [Trichoderma citrinoviride]
MPSPKTTATDATVEQAAESPAAVADSVQEAANDERAEDSDVEAGEVTQEDESDGSRDASSHDKSPEESSRADATAAGEAPPLPNEAVPDGPPLPDEPVPQQPEDDGWDCQWDPNSQAWFFYNRFTGKSQWENPRVPSANGPAVTSLVVEPQPPSHEKPVAGGYNPAIHGDYDPNAWYAKTNEEEEDTTGLVGDPAAIYAATATFNRFTGHFQAGEGAERHSDEAKSKRQMNAFFDVDAAANAHGGRSLKAERSNKKPTKNELKAFKEKRRARKEEKRRAWLRD